MVVICDETGCVRKMSGHGAVSWSCCSVLADDPGKSLTREKSTPFPPSRLSPEESLCAGNGPDGTRGEGTGALRDSGDFYFVHPCRVKSFRKAVSAVMDDLGKDADHRITLTE